ncbi:hypothetical protein WK92_09955 [Burkholderia ubonensis]|nr:hypothetical protein WK82_11310 [Burkholderia ubonensis]KVW24731.1 hypothetical protein WK92_09955 [Burkholderia ubonensis]
MPLGVTNPWSKQASVRVRFEKFVRCNQCLRIEFDVRIQHKMQPTLSAFDREIVASSIADVSMPA